MKILKLLVLFVFIQSVASGQSRWISGADNLSGSEGNQVMTGNVYFQKEGVRITCDRAVQMPNNRILATGNLVITREGSKLYGSEMDFDRSEDLARITSYTGIVRIVSKDGAVLKAPFVNYKLNRGEMSFSGGGVIESEGSIIEGEFGFYDGIGPGLVLLRKGIRIFEKGEYLRWFVVGSLFTG